MNADHTDLNCVREKVPGAGILEKVYQRAGLGELSLRGIRATAEASLAITYKGYAVGEYVADLLVNFQKPKVDWRRTVLRFQVPEPRVRLDGRAKVLLSPNLHVTRRHFYAAAGFLPS